MTAMTRPGRSVPRAAAPSSATPSLALRVEPAVRWRELLADARATDGATFVDLFAGPRRPDGVAVTLLLSLHGGRWLALRDVIADDGLSTLRSESPAVDWYERELVERFGLRIVGHADPLPLGYGGVESGGDDLLAGAPLGRASAGVVDYPLGPVRSGVVESGHYTIRTVGEEIVDLRLQLAYKHRGIEELALATPVPLVPLLAERISGTDAVANAIACCSAIEALAGLAVQPRADAIRAVAAELERLHDHASFAADLCGATGLVVAQAQFEIARERILRLAARLAGHRYLFGLVVPGGVGRDLDDAAVGDVRATVAEVRRAFVELGALARGSGSHMDRLNGTGRITPDDAEALALTGPVGRAAGLDADARRDHPYGAYVHAPVAVARAEGGDAAARMEVRLDEALVAADLIAELLERLPTGPAVPPDRLAPPRLAPDAAALGWAEGSRGTELHWLETDTAGDLARYRIRSASFACWQAFARAVPGDNILTDFPIIEQSFGLSFAGSDR